jgi:hypothetical protein
VPASAAAVDNPKQLKAVKPLPGESGKVISKGREIPDKSLQKELLDPKN